MHLQIIQHTTVTGEPYPENKSSIYMAFNDGKERTVSDEVFWRKDGTSITVEYTSTPIIEDGNIKGAVVVFRDVSERKHLQAQLVQSSKMATLGEMATGVAHELNQPLNIIRMALSNIQRKSKNGSPDPKYLIDKLNKIDSQVERAAAIIDHMRIFGRKPGAEPTSLDPRDIVDSTLGLIGAQLRLAEIEVDVDASTQCPSILGHQVQVEQVLLNLIGNAHDALKDRTDGEKRISISVSNSADQVSIDITDTGGGISEDALPRIFEPFFTTKEIGKGTGLGLSISYGIITDMNGTITAKNTAHGVKFTITLPAAAAPKDTPAV